MEVQKEELFIERRVFYIEGIVCIKVYKYRINNWIYLEQDIRKEKLNYGNLKYFS